jgi:predicted small lipoprotein YifL
MNRKRLLAVAVLALVLARCGVKGPPLPPEEVKPARITTLKAVPDRDGIRLTWPRPDIYATGRPMRDLAGFLVLRSQGQAELQTVADLPIPDRERFQKIDRLDWVDTSTAMGQTYRYAVVSMTDDGYRSDPSNQVEFKRIVPPPPVTPENLVLPKPSPAP